MNGRWYEGAKRYFMGDNYYVKTFSGMPNPPDDEIMKVCSNVAGD